MRLRLSSQIPVAPRMRATALGIVALVLVQIYLGALVAGLHAGLIYNTWPLIDGALVPDASRLFFETPAWRNFFDNTLLVQFNHRMAAYLLWAVALVHAADLAVTSPRGAFSSALWLAGAITVQAALGILTLLYQAPLALALAHQIMAIGVLGIAVVHAARFRHRDAPGGAPAISAVGAVAGRDRR